MSILLSCFRTFHGPRLKYQLLKVCKGHPPPPGQCTCCCLAQATCALAPATLPYLQTPEDQLLSVSRSLLPLPHLLCPLRCPIPLAAALLPLCMQRPLCTALPPWHCVSVMPRAGALRSAAPHRWLAESLQLVDRGSKAGSSHGYGPGRTSRLNSLDGCEPLGTAAGWRGGSARRRGVSRSLPAPGPGCLSVWGGPLRPQARAAKPRAEDGQREIALEDFTIPSGPGSRLAHG